MPSERAKKWKIKTKPELLTPKLEAIHELASEKIYVAYSSIDKLYEIVSKILDKHAISINNRILYRCFAEEIYKCKTKLKSKALTNTVNAIALKYVSYGCDVSILIEIAKIAGVEIDIPNSHILTFGLGYL